MFVDALLKVSDGQQVTADALSTYSIDLGDVTPKREVGSGEELGFAVVITAAGTNTGSSLLQVVSSAAEALTSTTIVGQLNIAAAGLAAGKRYFVPVAMGQPILRFLGMNHDITGTVDYTVTAWLTSRNLFAIGQKHYAKGYSV